MDKPLVSVYCLAYNHVKYIRDALEGFVSQETSFPFEVIVHDDASTDGTREIIMEYEKKYPDIIKPIYQEENQYSKGVPFIKNYINPLLKGKYIAVCEGDDYWCDSHKLQLQVDWLERHPDYSFCTHNTLVKDCQTGAEYPHRNYGKDRDLSVEEILEKGGATSHTSSYMYRSEFATLPEAFTVAKVGDYPRSIYLSMCGKVRYLDRVMSVYRLNTEGSWTVRTGQGKGRNKRMYELHCNIIKMLHNVDEYSNKKYTKRITEVIRKYEFMNLLISNDFPTMKKNYMDFYSRLSVKEKVGVFVRYYCPNLMKIYYFLRYGSADIT